MVVGMEEVVVVSTVEPRGVLNRLESLEVHERESVSETGLDGEHLAPTAEEFHGLFESREDAEERATGDVDGVGLTTLEELADRVVEQRVVVERHERDIERLREITSEQRDDVERLRERVESIQSAVSQLQRQIDEHG